jgi:hypothetical protein
MKRCRHPSLRFVDGGRMIVCENDKCLQMWESVRPDRAAPRKGNTRHLKRGLMHRSSKSLSGEVRFELGVLERLADV